jgi:hypothetical protein
VDSIPLTRPKRNISRDFSDGGNETRCIMLLCVPRGPRIVAELRRLLMCERTSLTVWWSCLRTCCPPCVLRRTSADGGGRRQLLAQISGHAQLLRGALHSPKGVQLADVESYVQCAFGFSPVLSPSWCCRCACAPAPHALRSRGPSQPALHIARGHRVYYARLGHATAAVRAR